MKRTFLKVAIISIVIVTTLCISVIYYKDYKANQIFHICNAGHDLHLQIFQRARIGDMSAHDALVRALIGDTLAIIEYASADLSTAMRGWDSNESHWINQFVGEYTMGLYTTIDKVGQERFLALCKNLPPNKRREVYTNMHGGKFGYETKYLKKYDYIFRNLSD